MGWDIDLIQKYYGDKQRTEEGKLLLSEISNDPRFQAIDGKPLASGGGHTILNVNNLGAWFLLAVDTHGISKARELLDGFYKAEKLKILKTLWVLGIDLDETIQLSNGYTIKPIRDIPSSSDKKYYEDNDADLRDYLQYFRKPRAALTVYCEIPKMHPDTLAAHEESMKDFKKASLGLYVIALLLNTFDGISCLPFYATGYIDDDFPLGVFSGSMGSSLSFDLTGRDMVTINNSIANELDDLTDAFNKLPKKTQDRFLISIRRLSQAKRKESHADKILDLCICLEMILLDGDTNQLALQFRLRGSWLLGNTRSERMIIFDNLRKIYNHRNSVAHSGNLSTKEYKDVIANFEIYSTLAGKIIRTLILNGFPKWDEIILGGLEIQSPSSDLEIT